MSTRSTVHFVHSFGDKPTAIIYRHSDGYPSEAGRDLVDFIQHIKDLGIDNRLSHPDYFAVKYVVFLTKLFNRDPSTGVTRVDEYIRRWAKSSPEWGTQHESPYDFISVGIMAEDPGDIEYRYIVANGEVKVYTVGDNVDEEGTDITEESRAYMYPEVAA